MPSWATTRRAECEQILRDNGADFVFIDTRSIAQTVREIFPEGAEKMLELVGTSTLIDSLQCAEQHGLSA